MTEKDSKIILELTMNEARILANAIASSLPSKEDEMISMMLYSRINKKVEETVNRTKEHG